MNKYQKYILSVLTERELLEQLTEEAAEMQQAAMKFIRAAGMSNNPTPISVLEARANLQEEISDVLAAIKLLKAMGTIADADYEDDDNPKWQRWAERLGYKDKAESESEEGELIKAFKLLKAYCDNNKGCFGCPFDGDGGCCFNNFPNDCGNIIDEA